MPNRAKKGGSKMSTYTSYVRETGIDGTSVQLDSLGRLRSGVSMEPFSSNGNPSVFYVDGNISTSGDGRTWNTAYKTLAEGLAAAHSYMSTSANRAWAHRATVFCCGDSFTEDLVLGAEKTDIIGVGSCDGKDRPTLIGNHVPATTNVLGMRWINWNFAEVDSGVIWTCTSVCSGMKFINCTFQARGANATHGILWTLSYDLEVSNCYFDTGPSGFSTGCIVIGAGVSDKIYIHDNVIAGAVGIAVSATYAQVAGDLIINNNVFRTAGLAIDDDSALAVVTNNQIISAGTIGANSYDFNVARAANNVVTGSDNTLDVPIKAV